MENGLTIRILKEIEKHPINDPITGHVLAAMFSTTLRNITQCIEEMRDQGFPVGSRKMMPYGYYYARNLSEIAPTIMTRRNQCMKIFTGNKKMLAHFESEGQQTIYHEMARIPDLEVE